MNKYLKTEIGLDSYVFITRIQTDGRVLFLSYDKNHYIFTPSADIAIPFSRNYVIIANELDAIEEVK